MRKIHVLTATGAIRASWAILIILVSTFAAAGIAVAYTIHNQHRSD